MKASVYEVYGGPEVLQIKELPKPIPKDNEVLIKIIATSVNRTDSGFRVAEYFIVRLFSGLFKPNKKVLGSEFSGVIEAIGSKVSSFKIGDAVFGLKTFSFGTHAEYICVKETASIALKPINMSHEEAGCVCDGMMLGMNFVKNVDFKKPVAILINGASGSIGSACLQLCKHFGARVTAVGNTSSQELLKSLGADKVLDYHTDDIRNEKIEYDFVFDTVGKSSFFKCKHILKANGVYISSELGYASQNLILPFLTWLGHGRKVKFPIPTDSKKDILFFKKLIEEGAYRAIIDRSYPLADIVEASRYVDSGNKTGNVVITVA